MSPSAHSAHSRAVSVDTAAPMSGGGTGGRLQMRARSTWMSPSALTSSPASRRRMTVTVSREARVPLVLRRVRVAGHVLVDRLAAAERGPEPAGVHRLERGDRLRGDRRVVPLPGRRDDAERQPRGLQRGAEPAPGESGLALPHAPRREVVASTSRRRSPPPRRAARRGGVGPGGLVRARRGIPRSSFALLPSSSTLPRPRPGRQPLAGRRPSVYRAGPSRLDAWQNVHPGRSARPSAGSSGRRRSTRTRGTTSSPRSSAPTSGRP